VRPTGPGSYGVPASFHPKESEFINGNIARACYTLRVTGNTNVTDGGIPVQKTNRSRWLEAFAPSAQMFHGLGKGLSRGRGQRLAEVPVSAATGKRESREKVFTEAA
jgi:hypothetical protein